MCKDLYNRVIDALDFGFKKIQIKKAKERAQFLGYSSSYYSSLVNGNEDITDDFLYKIADKLNLNYGWLKNGIGEMFNQPEVHNTISNTGAFSTNTINGDLGQQLSELISVQKGMQQDYLNLMQEKDRQIKELIEIIKQDECNGKQ